MHFWWSDYAAVEKYVEAHGNGPSSIRQLRMERSLAVDGYCCGAGQESTVALHSELCGMIFSQKEKR